MDDLENTASGGEGEALTLDQAMEATMASAFDTATDDPAPATGRDAQGRFVSAKPVETEIAEGAETGDPATNEGDQGNEAEGEGSGEAQATRAPASWSPAAKAAFDAADPAIQAEVLKRESDINKALQSHAEERKQFTGLQQVLGPRVEMLAEEHGSVEEGIADLFKISDFAASDGPGFIQWFAQQRGIDLAQLVTGQPAQGQGQQPAARDPVINGLMQQVQAISKHLSAAQQHQEQAEQAAADRKIEAFKANRPHFDAVRVQMGKLIQSGMAEDLEDAYDRAVHMDPALRKQVLDAADKARADQIAREAAEKAARARKAAGTNLRANGAPTAIRNGVRTMEETMSEAYDRAAGA